MASIRAEELARMYRRRHNIRRDLPAGVVDFLIAKQREGHKVSSLPPEDVVAMRVREPIRGRTLPQSRLRRIQNDTHRHKLDV
jgi:hypothetical protein